MPVQTIEMQGTLLQRITDRLPVIYVAIALFVSILLCALTPPMFIPDEFAHSLRAIEVGHGEWLAQRSLKGVGTMIDANAVRVMFGAVAIQKQIELRYPIAHQRPNGRISAAQLAPFRGIRWAGHSVFVGFLNTAVYPPVLYIPQAIGWRFGEAIDLTILHTLLLARLLAAISAIAIGWLAMRLCVSGRWLLFAYLLLPTKLSLNASCSQDALLLSIAGLIMALLSRPLQFKRSFTAAELLSITALVTVCILARPPYLPLVLVFLLPALSIRRVRRQQILPAALAIVIAVGVVGGWEVLVHSLGNTVGPDAQPLQQMSFLRAHPVEGVRDLLGGTAREIPQLVVRGMETLGGNDVFAPIAIYVFLFISILGLALLSPIDGLKAWRSRGLLLFALVATVAGLSFAEYIIWTPPGSHRVEGLQSRYYLPLVPLAFFFFSRRWRRQDEVASVGGKEAPWRKWQEVLLVISGSTFVIVVLYTPWIAAHSFYKLGLSDALYVAIH
jgi:uncharacterized membrane protein